MAGTELEQFLATSETRELLRFSTAGSVDDGKSTLIGRLLHDSTALFDDHLASVSKAGSSDQPDWALLLDGLKAEREQGITIDVAYRYFATPRRKFIIADTPGHEQYTRNMVTGASTADLALVLIDARHGVKTQSRRHAFIAALLGISRIVVAVNKMDLADWSQETFEAIRGEFADFCARLELPDVRFVPISALLGDNVVDRSANTPWYLGDPLLNILEEVHVVSDRNLVDLRFPVQCVLRPHLDFRGYAGTIASGILRPGSEVLHLPSGKTATVASISTFDGELEEAFPPMAVTVTLDRELDISRGDMLVRATNRPRVARRIEAMVVWMSERPLDKSTRYLLQHTHQMVRTTIDRLHYRLNVDSLGREDCETLQLNEIGRVELTAHRRLLVDPYRKNRQTGAFILIDPETNDTVGAGMILDRVPDEPEANPTRVAARRSERGHKERQADATRAAIAVWITGLVSSGKHDVALALERALNNRSAKVVYLAGGATRAGLSRDLGFGPSDTAEHLRRIAEVARLITDSGLVAICAFTSAVETQRQTARATIGDDRFLLVHLDAPVEWCEARDQTGLYAQARAGTLFDLAGVDVPYQTPGAADLTLDATTLTAEEAAARIVDLLVQRGVVD